MQKSNIPTILKPNLAPHHDRLTQIQNNVAANRKKKEGTPKKGA